MGTSNREPQEYSKNMKGIQGHGYVNYYSIPTVFLEFPIGVLISVSVDVTMVL